MLSSKWYCSSSQKICPWWCCSYLCFLGQSCHWRTRHRNYPSKGAANTARIPYDVPFWLYQLSSDKSYTWNIHYQLKAKVEATKNYVRFISVNSVCVCVVTIFSLDDTSPDIWAAFKAYLHLQIRIAVLIPIPISFLYLAVKIGIWIWLRAVWKVLHSSM